MTDCHIDAVTPGRASSYEPCGPRRIASLASQWIPGSAKRRPRNDGGVCVVVIECASGDAAPAKGAAHSASRRP